MHTQLIFKVDGAASRDSSMVGGCVLTKGRTKKDANGCEHRRLHLIYNNFLCVAFGVMMKMVMASGVVVSTVQTHFTHRLKGERKVLSVNFHTRVHPLPQHTLNSVKSYANKKKTLSDEINHIKLLTR